ncbi:hypothetical protein SAMN02744783_02948 [Serratia sp. CC22-02]|uniref:hypothetical protein n=1 Tax=Serratia sp. CC22-02 TaxID=1378076 RepID=UPI0024038514|nr:hypothetical protein [Serratia sp. CC22-02]SMP68422.1 hypothetical protein SAMN02744783_02948 [Serratia sp. CC22-02]
MSNNIIVNTKLQSLGYTGKVYRFFDKEEYANEFCQGKIRISTLNACRDYENAEQGDKGEATWKHSISLVNDYEPSKKQIEALRWAGVRVDPESRGNSFADITARRRLDDAYILCTTKYFDPDIFSDSFGKYCVEISNAHKFCVLVTEQIARIHKNTRIQALYDDVHYLDREGTDLNVPKVNIGFIKPAIPYAVQKEFRFLWLFLDQNPVLNKLDIQCKELSKLCTRVK